MNPWMLFKRGFMAYWYWHVRKLNELWPSITLGDKTLVIFPGVYKPLENEQSCVEYCNHSDRVLDLGCGSGVCAVFAAGVAQEVLAVDISPAAIDNTKENCRRLGRENVTVMRSDMFTNVDGRFNLILANPPISRPISRTMRNSSPPRPDIYRSFLRKFTTTLRKTGACSCNIRDGSAD